MSAVGAEHDRFHLPTDGDPLWSETSWFGFAAPERGLAGSVYPLFRPNLGTCSVAAYVWDARAHEPWRVPYGRCLWHQPMPADLTALRVGPLSIDCEEPLSRYRVRWDDADLLRLDLTYEGLIPPHAVGVGAARGHLDQPCRVRGKVSLRGETIAVDGYEMRDRSWGPRDDLRTTRACYTYGIASERDAFLAAGFPTEGGEAMGIFTGFLLRDGEKADLVSGERRIVASESGFPTRVEVNAEDRLGRRLHAVGRCTSRLASQATPGMFAWMSLTAWEMDGLAASGEDQDVWSPDLLGRSLGRH